MSIDAMSEKQKPSSAHIVANTAGRWRPRVSMSISGCASVSRAGTEALRD